jgi:hypothetical protein
MDKSKSTIRSILTHHRQNPTEIIDLLLFYLLRVKFMRAKCPAHTTFLGFGHPNNSWWCVQVMKLLIMQSSAAPATSNTEINNVKFIDH